MMVGVSVVEPCDPGTDRHHEGASCLHTDGLGEKRNCKTQSAVSPECTSLLHLRKAEKLLSQPIVSWGPSESKVTIFKILQ